MIPIIVLSVSVLLYGLLLSLEQRRREIAIHRTIGGGPDALLRMVLGELGVMAFSAWLVGYGDGADEELKAMQGVTAAAPAVRAEKAEAGDEPEAEQDDASEEDAISGLGAMIE